MAQVMLEPAALLPLMVQLAPGALASADSETGVLTPGGSATVKPLLPTDVWLAALDLWTHQHMRPRAQPGQQARVRYWHFLLVVPPRPQRKA